MKWLTGILRAFRPQSKPQILYAKDGIGDAMDTQNVAETVKTPSSPKALKFYEQFERPKDDGNPRNSATDYIGTSHGGCGPGCSN